MIANLRQIRIIALVLCAVSFLLLSYQFGSLSGSQGIRPTSPFFAASAALTAMAVLLVAHVQWLQLIVGDYVLKVNEYDYIEGRHCADLIQMFRRPMVTIETRPEDVAEVAAKAIREVLKRTTEDGRRIVFFGAASLQTAPKGWVPVRTGAGVDAEDEQSPHQIYQGALEAAASSRAHVERYVRLMGHEFQGRSYTIKVDYLKWLKNQISQMTRNENFVLIDSTRAPRWGTSGARIMAGEFLIDLTHKSGSAIVIKDARIASEQIASGIKAAHSAKRKGNVIIYSKGPISDLKARFGENAEQKFASDLTLEWEQLREKLIAK